MNPGCDTNRRDQCVGDESICKKIEPFIGELIDSMLKHAPRTELYACIGEKVVYSDNHRELLERKNKGEISCPILFHTHPSGANFLSLDDITTATQEDIPVMCVGTLKPFNPYRIDCFGLNSKRLSPLKNPRQNRDKIDSDPVLSTLYYDDVSQECDCWCDLKKDVVTSEAKLRVQSEGE